MAVRRYLVNVQDDATEKMVWLLAQKTVGPTVGFASINIGNHV
jgi:hypothetical protein